jgi:geranylgeranyl reductase family protein
MSTCDFDLLIAGAGPAGCTLALNLAPKGLRIGIIEKDHFPRNKICGDALSGKVLSVMKRIPGGVYTDFLQDVAAKIPSRGIRFMSPDGHAADVPFQMQDVAEQSPPGYICGRRVFDSFMASQLERYPNIELWQGEGIEQVRHSAGGVVAKTKTNEFTGRIIAGADGVHSVVRRSFLPGIIGRNHLCIGIRGYYENVSDIHSENFIELIFLKRLLPGYFWIFPSAGGLVNAGFGMLQNKVIRTKENLTRLLNDLTAADPLLAPRFRNARLTGKAEAHTLPLGTHRFTRSGNRFLLLGDAAFLVDPFSGEGIGNAMSSGEIAAQVLAHSFDEDDFSAGALLAYDKRLHRRFSSEFSTMSAMQRLAKYPGLINLVLKKAGSNSEVKALLTAMFTNESLRKRLIKPEFYIRLLLGRMGKK